MVEVNEGANYEIIISNQFTNLVNVVCINIFKNRDKDLLKGEIDEKV